jgi:hypothetical protein
VLDQGRVEDGERSGVVAIRFAARMCGADQHSPDQNSYLA